MKIRFDTSDYQWNVDKRTTEKQDAPVQKIGTQSGFQLDISGTVMDNSAYRGQGRTTEEVMGEAGQQNQEIALQRNYMAVMSNSMSDEDFAKLQEEGFHPGSTEIGEVVTIVDRIKASLMQAGVEIKGYTDTVDMDALVEITGSEAYARELTQAFAEEGVPLTGQTAREAVRILDEQKQLDSLSDGAVKYMVENHREPTAENVYLAQFSGGQDSSRQAKGYYQDGAGYLARKADEIDWQALQPQVEAILKEAGFSGNAQGEEYAQWIVEKGIPLTAEALQEVAALKQLTLPKKEEEIAKAVAAAVSDGKKPKDADLVDSRSLWEKAAAILEEVEGLSEEAADVTAAKGHGMTIRNLAAAQRRLDAGQTGAAEESISARRQLEEVRLAMTIQANRELLKSGYAIDTAELEALVEALKQVEKEQKQALFLTTDAEEAVSREQLFDNTLHRVQEIPGLPAAVIGKISPEPLLHTLEAVAEEGAALKAAYEKAGQEYETLMTAPRSDLGDSIKKAFQNVNGLLEELNLPQTEKNQRAVRILGYNSMEISEENIARVKAADQSLKNIIHKMSPSAVLSMIREGKNPLTMSLEEMDDYFAGQEREPEEETEKYSKFLYKLEQQKEISEEEKQSYIGIYRLLRQVEKTDGAVIGSLVKQGAGLSFRNLLTAVRTGKSQGIRATVDDDFGLLERTETEGQSISDQINSAYYTRLARDVSRNLDGESIARIAYDENTNLEEFAVALEEVQRVGQEINLEESYRKEQVHQIRQMQNVEDSVFAMLEALEEPVTVDSILAATGFLKGPAKVLEQLDKAAKERQNTKWQQSLDALEKNFDEEEGAKKAYGDMLKEAETVVEEAVFETPQPEFLHIKEMGLLYKQISFMARIAQEEEYEIPIQTGDFLTAMHLKIVHSAEEGGRLEASLEEKEAGQIKVRLQLQGQTANGLLAYSRPEGSEKMKRIAEAFQEQLKELGYEAKGLKPVYSESLPEDRWDFAVKGSAGTERTAERKSTPRTAETAEEKENGVSTKTLYKLAKTLITAIKNNNE